MQTGRVKRYKKGVEQKYQEAFVEWFGLNYKCIRELLNVSSFGENIGAKRMKSLKDMGLTPGWPDLFLAVPKRLSPHHPIMAAGLFIEMKKETGRISPKQKKIHDLLIGKGYQVNTCYNCDEAIAVTKNYLKYFKDIQCI